MTLQLLDDLWTKRIERTVIADTLHNLGQYTNPYVIVQIMSATAEPGWTKGGYIGQKVPFQGFIALASQQEIRLNLLSVLFFPILTSQDYYELQYYAPKRLGQVDFTLWEYTGEINNQEIEDIDNLLKNTEISATIDLSLIDKKLDEISVNQNLVANQNQQKSKRNKDNFSGNYQFNLSFAANFLPGGLPE